MRVYKEDTVPTVVVCGENPNDANGPAIRLLEGRGFDVRVVDDVLFGQGNRSNEEEIECLKGANATVAWGERYPAAVIEELPDLRVIARMGVGFDKVDLKSASERARRRHSHSEREPRSGRGARACFHHEPCQADRYWKQADATGRVALRAGQAPSRNHAGNRGAGADWPKPGSASRRHADAGHRDGAVSRPRHSLPSTASNWSTSTRCWGVRTT